MKQEDFEHYFENLGKISKDIPPENIVNYDETTIFDDPRQEKLIFKRGKNTQNEFKIIQREVLL